MRALARLSAMAGLALALSTLPSGSASAVDRMAIKELKTVGTDWRRQIEVHVVGGLGVASIKAALSTSSSETPYATVDDFDLVSGTAADGVWRSDTAVTVKHGLSQLEATAMSVDHDRATAATTVLHTVTPRLTGVTTDHEPADAGQRTVRYQGQVVYTGPDGSDLPASGGATLYIGEYRRGGARLDAEGRFSGTATVRYGGTARVGFSGGIGYRGVQSETTAQIPGPELHHTRLTPTSVTPSPVGKGAVLTLAARLVRSSDENAPIAGAPVSVEFSADGTAWTGVGKPVPTDGAGNVRISVTATRDGHWRLRYAGDLDGSPDAYDATNGDSRYVDVRYRTAVSSFNASPEPVSKGRPLTVSGVVKRSVDGSTWKAWSAQTVYVYFKAKGATSWSYAGTVKSDAYGKFRRSFTASKDGTWKAVYKGNADYLRADSATDYVDVR